MSATIELMSLARWKNLPPFQQGFVLYMQAAHRGSELAGLKCPYVRGTSSYRAFQEGQQRAVLVAQDSEE